VLRVLRASSLVTSLGGWYEATAAGAWETCCCVAGCRCWPALACGWVGGWGRCVAQWRACSDCRSMSLVEQLWRHTAVLHTFLLSVAWSLQPVASNTCLVWLGAVFCGGPAACDPASVMHWQLLCCLCLLGVDAPPVAVGWRGHVAFVVDVLDQCLYYHMLSGIATTATLCGGPGFAD
jgi:hypothetical protein